MAGDVQARIYTRSRPAGQLRSAGFVTRTNPGSRASRPTNGKARSVRAFPFLLARSGLRGPAQASVLRRLIRRLVPSGRNRIRRTGHRPGRVEVGMQGRLQIDRPLGDGEARVDQGLVVRKF